MLRFILGRSKSGKTKYVRDYLAALAKEGKSNLLMIVPDQQTFDTEKAFLNLLGPKISPRVTVMGFSRLCGYVFEHCGYTPGVMADDSVKSLLMSVALEETSHQLSVYKENFSSPRLIEMLLNLRCEFIDDRSDIKSVLESDLTITDTLRLKLQDISLILSAYDALLENSFEDPDGELSLAYDLMTGSSLFEDYVVCIDSYLSFSQLEYDIIELIMMRCKEMLVTLSDDGIYSEDSIFSVSHNTYSKLKNLASKNGVTVAKSVMCDYDGYFKNEELRLLEENVFRFRTDDEVCEQYEDAPQYVKAFAAADVYAEADFVARNIRRLVMDEGYKYNDIAVVSRDLSPYRNVLDSIMTKYDISYFMDAPLNVLSSPLMKLVSAVFEVVVTGFNKDSVLSLLKSGLVNVDTVDASLFENYIFTWSISGKRIFSEFEANPRGFAEEFTTDDLYELTRVEKVRKFIATPLAVFANTIKDADVRTMCEALYNLMLSLGVTDSIRELCASLESLGEHRLCEEQERLWEVFIDTLDRTVKVIGNRKISPKDLSRLLMLQFVNLELAYIPKALDSVTVGDIERLRLSDKKVIFVIGAAEGVFPGVSEKGGIFTGNERRMLSDAGLLCDDSAELEYMREMYNCYYALTSPSEYLFVSYPVHKSAKEENLPSRIFSELGAVLKQLRMSTDAETPQLDKLWSGKASFNAFAARVGSGDMLTRALEEYYVENEYFSASAISVRNAKNRVPYRIENKNNAQMLFGKDMYLSPSQVETYHKCRFSYFLKYGLKIRERAKAEMNPMEFGTCVHYILEKFLKKFNKAKLQLLTRQDIKREINQLLQEYSETFLGGFEDKSHRFMYLFNRIVNSATIIVEHLIEELLQSEFTPDAFELNIGEDVPAYTLDLPDGGKVIIRGKVDRADVCEINGEKYIRIIDYKTGKRVFSLSDVMYGLDLQMLIYLSAISNSKEGRYRDGYIPAGVLYLPATASAVSVGANLSEEDIKAELYKKLRMNGLLLDNETVLDAMEKDIKGVYIPISLGGKRVSGKDNLATLAQFGAIFSRIDKLIYEMATTLKDGKVDAIPAKGSVDACEYCPYKSICRHRDEDSFVDVAELKYDEIMSELLEMGEEGENEQTMD